jgi:hypothetical protein
VSLAGDRAERGRPALSFHVAEDQEVREVAEAAYSDSCCPREFAYPWSSRQMRNMNLKWAAVILIALGVLNIWFRLPYWTDTAFIIYAGLLSGLVSSSRVRFSPSKPGKKEITEDENR